MRSCQNSNCREVNPQLEGNFGVNRRRDDGLQVWCRTCLSDYYKNTAKTKMKLVYDRNVSAGLCGCGQPLYLGKRCRRCFDKQNQWRHNLKFEVFAAYGNRCVCCGEERVEFFSIDHINGSGKEHRKQVSGYSFYLWLKKNGFPKDNFRLLCMNCNFARGKFGYCPHERERKTVEA